VASSCLLGRNPPLGGIVVLTPEFVETSPGGEQLNDYLDQRGVAKHARPDVLTEMSALPTTAVGKIDKNAIARQLRP
jgi:mycobactin salicyl-AMP ligase